MSASTQQNFVWTDQFLLGYGPMDATHREFVDLLDALLAAPDGELAHHLDAMAEHAERHFGEEREWMLATDFPAAQCHMDEHDAVLKSVYEVRALLEGGGHGATCRALAQELVRWFPGHADYIDAALAQWMAKCRMRGIPVVLRRGAALSSGLARARTFYDHVLAPLGFTRLLDIERRICGWGIEAPQFMVGYRATAIRPRPATARPSAWPRPTGRRSTNSTGARLSWGPLTKARPARFRLRERIRGLYPRPGWTQDRCILPHARVEPTAPAPALTRKTTWTSFRDKGWPLPTRARATRHGSSACCSWSPSFTTMPSCLGRAAVHKDE